MKYALIILISLFYSCKPKPKEILRFVNDQNDGFNAFNVCIYSDSTYEKKEWSSDDGGYNMQGEDIYFTDGPLQDYKLILTKDSKGCIWKPQLIYKDYIIAMRTIFDSVCCKP